MPNHTEQQVIEIQEKMNPWLLGQAGVLGTSVGLNNSGQVVLRIFTSGISDRIKQLIAERLGNVPVEWEEGDIMPL